MLSLFGQYIKERENTEIVETENGFATYAINGDDCYIKDIFVKKEHRRSHLASEMADKIAKIAKEKGCKVLIGSCVPSTNGSTESLKTMFAYGFKLHSCTNDFIIVSKEI